MVSTPRVETQRVRLSSSLRCRAPEQTLDAAESLMPLLGIRRVTDATRLDRLGVPVFASIRPRGRTLRVNAGKGVRPVEARVGALMEAVEYAVSERASVEALQTRLTIGDLIGELTDDLHWLDFAPRVGVPVDTAQPVVATPCEFVGSGREVLLPAELVLIAPPVAQPSQHFGWTTTGLASGNSLEEATLHAIFEVLERDALAMNQGRDESVSIDTSTLPAPFADWAERWRQLGVHLLVNRLPSEFGMACYEAFLHEPSSPDVNLATGSGLHAEHGIALARAVSEAAQSRISFIHGGRDDITRFYAKFDPRNPRVEAIAMAEAQLLEKILTDKESIAFDVSFRPAPSNQDVPSLLDEVLRRMAARGFDKVLRRRFDIDDGLLDRHGLHVVKVLVPRCEDIATDARRMGRRLFARVMDGSG